MALWSNIKIKDLRSFKLLCNIGASIDDGDGYVCYDKSINLIVRKTVWVGPVETDIDYNLNQLKFPGTYIVWHYNTPNTLAIIAANKNLQIVD